MIVIYHSKSKGVAFSFDRQSKLWLCHRAGSALPVTPRTAVIFLGSKLDHWQTMVVPGWTADVLARFKCSTK